MITTIIYKCWLCIHYIMIIVALHPNIYPHFIFNQLCKVAITNIMFKNWIFPVLAQHTNIENVIGSVKRPGSNKGGMPSGHCQVYWTVVIYLNKHNKNIPFQLTSFIIGMLLIHNRIYLEKKHTMNQVLIGSIIGCLTGYYYLP